MIVFTLVCDMAAIADHFHLVVRGIDDGFVILGQTALAGLVIVCRELLAERLVGAFVVVGVAPAFEAALLGGHIYRWWLGRFSLQITVHAFMRAVVLGRGRPGELDLDALLDPPKAQAGKPPQSDGGKRRAVINADHLRQTDLAHQVLKRPQGALELLVFPGLTGEHVVTPSNQSFLPLFWTAVFSSGKTASPPSSVNHKSQNLTPSAEPESVTYLPRLSVTHLPGSYRSHQTKKAH